MIIAAPVRFDRMRECLQGVLTDALGSAVTVKWGRDSVQRDSTKASMVSLTTSTGAVVSGNWRGRRLVLSPISISFTVTSATIGTLYSVYLNGFPYRYEVTGVEAVDDVRNALLALVVADARSPYSAAAGGAGELVITGDYAGALFQAEALPAPDWTIAQGATSATAVRERPSVTTLTVGSYSKGVDIFDGASDLDARVNAALSLQQYQTTFADFGVSLQSRGTPTDISAIAGASWETRVSRDIGVGLRSVTTETIESIETVDMTSIFQTSTGQSIFTQNYTLT